MADAIRCESVTKHYGKVKALDNLSLEVAEGSVFGFLGPNGAGKTTTIKLLTSLGQPDSGSIWIKGQPLSRNPIYLRSKIGYLPEEPTFYGWMTGREFLQYVGELFGLAPPEIRRRSQELLQLAGLETAANRRVGGYSRGMRQRLGIAQALMNQPEVLLLDEPASALDPIGRREILELISRLGQRATVFMSTHILADVERVCDTVAIIDRGRLVAQASIEELREQYAPSVFELQFENGDDRIAKTLQGLPWIVKVEKRTLGDSISWRVFVKDLALAKMELPKIASAQDSPLVRYELMQPSLEEVFLVLLEERK